MSNKEIKAVFQMERRNFLKWSALAGAAGMMVNFPEAMAAGECASNLSTDVLDAGVIPLSKASTDDYAKEFFYWVDGAANLGMKSTEGAVAARLAVYLNLKLQGYFLESVVITDPTRRILEERRFTASAKASTGKPPYAIFDNLVLNYGTPYHVYFVLSSTDAQKKVVVYRYEIAGSDIRNSRFDYAHLSADARKRIPKMFLEDMGSAGHAEVGKQDMEYGIITTPYQHFAGLGAGGHIVRVRFKNYTADGSFTTFIEPMHGDVNTFHYMRYFIVMDPVGLFLGVKKRQYNAGIAGHQETVAANNGTTVGGQTLTFSGLEGHYKVSNGYVASPFTPSGVDDWANQFNPYINKEEISILDCPYVHVVTEDRRDSISKISVRLR